MKFKSLVTLIMTLCLAVLTSNAMASSDKSGKSDKSAKSEKSEKSAKSHKRGKGYGHCKSDKSGKGHKKKRGRGHNRDCDDDSEPPVLVCVADMIDPFIELEEIFDEETLESLGFVTVAISYTGKICAVGDEAVFEADVFADGTFGDDTLCEHDATASSVSLRMEDTTNFWYDMNTVLRCGSNLGN
ncbi:MAG: hypothetical protein JKY86_09545 [Gammaproteobacteria bacterium]|nr:hypothetical protein [Gammaproteobacteria bacterium]